MRRSTTKIRDVLVAINRGGIGVVLITEGLKLIATVTDGDMRRALLDGQDLGLAGQWVAE